MNGSDRIEQRLKTLEDENKKLKQTLHRLLNRLAYVEKRANQTYHTSRNNENRVNHLQSVLRGKG